ncbi:Integral membrane protein [Carbonactinospora thermoautotrophica]|uniref:Integral membrane protein n=1 Tax=Carbonactinospora thermoautotrophica TaxID=1469144 RepID=A0A132MW43_9ACTN|nr:zf-HC2 domain-containing protein [Carbonactinospora thermoautotrophica]KWX02125.1 Integral membrane protein [Carbonactinospora thermoautotrophica]
MTCSQFREALSARLDGEDPGLGAEAVDAHLAECAACAAWYEDAARVTRLARLAPARPVPDLVGAVLAVAPLPVRDRRWARLRWARLALAGVGLAQFGLAGFQVAHHYLEHTHLAGSAVQYLAHESASWSLALAIGMLWVAGQVRRAAGLLPVLAAFVGLLALMTGVDLLTGKLDIHRIGSYVLLVAGLLLVAWIARLAPDAPLPRSGDPQRAAGPHASSAAGSPPAGPDVRVAARGQVGHPGGDSTAARRQVA